MKGMHNKGGGMNRSLFRVYSFKICNRRRTKLFNIMMHVLCVHDIICQGNHPEILTFNICCFTADYHDELYRAPKMKIAFPFKVLLIYLLYKSFVIQIYLIFIH